MILKKMYNDEINILFDEAEHSYTLVGKPGRIMSVSAIAGVASSGGDLIKWGVGLATKYLKERMGEVIDLSIIENAGSEYIRHQKKAFSIGNKVHKYVENHVNAERQGNIIDKNALNSIAAFHDWVKAEKPEFVETEKMLYSRNHNFVGIADILYKLDGKLILGDFKTSRAIYNNYFIQAAGYALAYEEEFGVPIDDTSIIRLDKSSGKYEVAHSYNLEEDKKAFLSCLAVKKRMKTMQEEKKQRFKDGICLEISYD